MLTQPEINRYRRQIQLNEIQLKGQEQLKNAKVLVIGAGGLGCPVLQYLCAAGVGHLGIVDFDLVDETNLHRQVIFGDDDVGKPKARVVYQKLIQQNKYIKLEHHDCKLDVGNALELFSAYHIIVDCSDNFETRYIINDACVHLKKPMVYGGIHKFEGQMAVFNLNQNSPTYRCAFPEKSADADIINCSITGVLGTLPGIIGTMQANEVLKIITGIGEVVSGKMILYNGLNNTMNQINLRRNKDVLCSHFTG